GARRSFVITADAATPGYLAGELEPGTWQVIIGIHRLPPEGAEYRLEAEVSGRRGAVSPGPVPPPPPPPAARSPPPRPAAPGRPRPPLARRRPPHPHGALRRCADGSRAVSLCSGPGS